MANQRASCSHFRFILQGRLIRKSKVSRHPARRTERSGCGQDRRKLDLLGSVTSVIIYSLLRTPEKERDDSPSPVTVANPVTAQYESLTTLPEASTGVTPQGGQFMQQKMRKNSCCRLFPLERQGPCKLHQVNSGVPGPRGGKLGEDAQDAACRHDAKGTGHRYLMTQPVETLVCVAADY